MAGPDPPVDELARRDAWVVAVAVRPEPVAGIERLDLGQGHVADLGAGRADGPSVVRETVSSWMTTRWPSHGQLHVRARACRRRACRDRGLEGEHRARGRLVLAALVGDVEEVPVEPGVRVGRHGARSSPSPRRAMARAARRQQCTPRASWRAKVPMRLGFHDAPFRAGPVRPVWARSVRLVRMAPSERIVISRRARAQPQGHRPRAAAQLADRHDRALGLRQVEPRLRHDLRRGPAPLRRVALGLRAPVPRADGEARRGLDRGPVAGDLDRPEDDLAQPALDRRHRDRDLRLPAPALGADRQARTAPSAASRSRASRSSRSPTA